MSVYSSRRGPNMHQYIATLNNAATPPRPQEPDLTFGTDESLGLFANTDFFDFDMGSDTLNDLPPLRAASKPVQPDLAQTSPLPTDFLDTTDFNFGDLDGFGTLAGVPSAFSLPALPVASTASPVSAPSPATSSAPRASHKRKASAANLDGSPRVAAEEDKRRRNTAASARFRVKKKQREQALEKTAREMTEKAAALEIKVQQLEMENKWLKGLITERDLDSDVKLSTSGLDALFEKFRREEGARSSGAGSD